MRVLTFLGTWFWNSTGLPFADTEVFCWGQNTLEHSANKNNKQSVNKLVMQFGQPELLTPPQRCACPSVSSVRPASVSRHSPWHLTGWSISGGGGHRQCLPRKTRQRGDICVSINLRRIATTHLPFAQFPEGTFQGVNLHSSVK